MNIMVLLNYNDAELTKRYASKVKEYAILDKIIIVDNCSTDDSYKILEEICDEKIILIKTPHNGGYASGNNYGIRYAEKHFSVKKLVISNPDIDVCEKSIVAICRFLDNNHRVAAASCVIMDRNNEVVNNFAWRLPTYAHILTSTFISLHKVAKHLFHYSVEYNKSILKNELAVKVGVLSGCFFIIKAEILKQIGYFDEDTFLYCEENILAFKLNKQGYEQYVLSQYFLIHFHGETISKVYSSWLKQQEILKKSTLVYLKKYLKAGKTKIILFCIFFEIGKYEKFVLLKLKRKLCKR